MAEKQKKSEWHVKSHSWQIADTGDMDGYWEITNGVISLRTRDEGNDEWTNDAPSDYQRIADALNKSGALFFEDDADAFFAQHWKSEYDRLYGCVKKTEEALKEFIILEAHKKNVGADSFYKANYEPALEKVRQSIAHLSRHYPEFKNHGM